MQTCDSFAKGWRLDKHLRRCTELVLGLCAFLQPLKSICALVQMPDCFLALWRERDQRRGMPVEFHPQRVTLTVSKRS